MAFLDENQLKNIGFLHYGNNVKISDKVSFYNPAKISIGDYSRIDDFCVLSAGEDGIEIGRNVHLSIGVTIVGRGKIIIRDFAGLSAKCSIFSSNDDYSGAYLTNPTVDSEYTNVTIGEVYIGKHVVIGAHSIILPNVKINDGASVGSMSLIKSDCESFYVYAGIPAKIIKERNKDLLKLEDKFLKGK